MTFTKHGLHRHRLYSTWKGMVARCTNPKEPAYKHYGGRGIKVCERWLDVKNFIDDMYPSFIEGLQLDRKENDKGYSPDNCRWATPSQNGKNKRCATVKQSNVDRVSYDKHKDHWRVVYCFKNQEEAEQFARGNNVQ